MKYQTRPQYVEALQLTEDRAWGHILYDERLPWGLTLSGSWNAPKKEMGRCHIYITLGNGQTALCYEGDWIIKQNGVFKAVLSNGAFEAQYMPVEAI